jgi:hypothetical protein
MDCQKTEIRWMAQNIATLPIRVDVSIEAELDGPEHIVFGAHVFLEGAQAAPESRGDHQGGGFRGRCAPQRLHLRSRRAVQAAMLGRQGIQDDPASDRRGGRIGA